jgi:hypothetical protein
MQGILNAPKGLMVFNITDSSLYLRRDSGWMKINSAPENISFSGSLTATQALPNFTYVSPAPYTELFDNGAGFNPTSGIYTVPADGVYHFDILVSMNEVPVNTACITRIYVNGSIPKGGQTTNIVAPRPSYTVANASAINLILNKNDQVSFQFLQASGTTNNVFSNGTVNTTFSGFRVN